MKIVMPYLIILNTVFNILLSNTDKDIVITSLKSNLYPVGLASSWSIVAVWRFHLPAVAILEKKKQMTE